MAFLEYFQNHLKKIEFLEVRLKTFSYCLLIPGVAFLAYGAYSYLGVASPKGKLGTSMVADESMVSALDGISMIIWGLVAAKAKQGADASNSKSAETVG